MTRMLASVSNLDEALLVLVEGVDIIDLKAPTAGALGALPVDRVALIVNHLAGKCPLSATVGDLPMDPALVRTAAVNMAATGVDYVKIGFFPTGDWRPTIEELAANYRGRAALIAVLLADVVPDLAVIEVLQHAGFRGVMLDTWDKQRGSLLQICDRNYLSDFVASARASGLLSGLAGSLRLQDIAGLLPLAPDYLGFRGALCRHNRRTADLDRLAVRAVRALLAGSPILECNDC